MSKLWFDPSADVASHDPPLKPLDPSRPIRKSAGGTIKVDMPDSYSGTFDWANYVGGVFVAPEKDPA
jgi:hypothetical protein